MDRANGAKLVELNFSQAEMRFADLFRRPRRLDPMKVNIGVMVAVREPRKLRWRLVKPEVSR
jgi:hypothetical protein